MGRGAGDAMDGERGEWLVLLWGLGDSGLVFVSWDCIVGEERGDAGIDGMEKVEEWLSRIVELMSCLSGGFL